jgi:hypothetical protein
MRTCVRMMGVGPYRPTRELRAAIERRELDMAIGIAKDIARERRPIGLELALGLVSLVAAEGEDYDVWACRWLERWLSETPGTSIALAAEVAATLADLPAEPQAVEAIRELVRR